MIDRKYGDNDNDVYDDDYYGIHSNRNICYFSDTIMKISTMMYADSVDDDNNDV